MKELNEAEKILAGEHKQPPARVLGIARRLEEAANAGNADAAVLRVRLVNQLIREAPAGVEVEAAAEGGVLVRIGARGAPCVVRHEEIERETVPGLRDRFGVDVGRVGEDAPEGLSVRPVEAGTLSVCSGLDGAGCLAKAREMEEAYDYETALGCYRLAVLRTKGGRSALEALARFLVESYGYYDEAVELLTSPRVDVAASPLLVRTLADAHYQLGQLPEAEPLYRLALDGAEDPAEVRRRLGQCRLEVLDLKGALQHLHEAARLEPGDPRTAELLERAQAGAHGAAVEVAGRARAALESGQLDLARQLAEQARKDGLDGVEIARLTREIEAADKAGGAGREREEARAHTEAGRVREATAALRRALDLMPGSRDIEAELAHAEAAVVHLEVEEQLRRADELEASDPVAALRAWYRALQAAEPVGGIAPGRVARSPLLALLADYVRKERPKHLERSLEGLVALHRSRQALLDEDASGALAAAEEALRLVRGYAPINEALERARAAVSSRNLMKAQGIYEAALAREAEGRLEDALLRLDEIVALAGADYRDVAERRKAVREGIDRDRRARELLARVRKLLFERSGFRALQLLDQASGELGQRADLAALIAEARRAVDELYPLRPVTPAGPPPVPGAVPLFDAARLGVSAITPKEVRVVLDDEGGRLVLLIRSLLVLLRGDDLRVEAAVELPPSLALGGEGDALFTAEIPGGLRVMLLQDAERALTVIDVGAGGARLVARHDLAPLLGPLEGTVRSYAYDPAGNLLVLELNRQGGRQESRFLAISVEDGRQRFREAYNQPIFNLQPVRGTSRFTASRIPDATARFMPGWYHLVVLDGRGKIQERVTLSEVDEEPYALRQAIRGPSSGRVFAEYWGLDPMTRQVRGSGNSLLVFRPDWGVFYQTSQPGLLLGDDRKPNGSMALHVEDGVERLLLPWRSSTGESGVALVDAADVRPLGHIRMAAGVHVGAVRADIARGRAYVVTFSEAPGFLARHLHPSEATDRA